MKVVEVEVEVISEEIIKPSSPTPNHLRRYEFSFLDQINPPVYAGLVLFFESNPETQTTISEISKHLKKSLSEVLSLYYPLAGRVKAEDHFVDCNDHGVPFLEAQVTNCRLCDVLENLVPGELNKLVPFELDDVANEFALGVQLNVFGCGGFVIGLCTTHKLADALSMLGFSRTWAAVARGVHDRPQFVSATLFPAKEFIGYNSRLGITKNKVTKRFVFDASTIEDLRAKYTRFCEDDEIMKRPMTRVETLSAFIWRRFVEATKDDEDKLHMVNHAVNLRPKFDPPLPPNSFGNLSRISTTNPISLTSHGDRDRSCIDMMREVRVALSKIDNEYVKSLQKGDEHLSFIKKYADKFTRGEVVTFTFTSLCRLPLYDNDFGWGSPTWVGLPALTFKNLVLLVDTKEGDGIEAYISLAKEAMAKFESDSEILSHVSTVRAGLSLPSTRLVAKL